MRAAVLEAPAHTEDVLDLASSPPFVPQASADDAWREAQRAWAERRIQDRLAVLRRARHAITQRADEFAAAISAELARTRVDTLVAEVLPLLEACRFLERNAAKVLASRRLGRRGLPFWLAGVDSEVRRVPFGKVLVFGPANYPLFLPGVQALQGLAAGNAVVWKPGRGGRAVADLFAEAMAAAGLPSKLLRITAESIEAARVEIAAGAGKVFFTGSAETGKSLLRELAQTATPCVMELSGCDAVVVLPLADLERVVRALAFGMRLNGSATCMAPRRVFVVGASAAYKEQLAGRLSEALGGIDGVPLSATTRQLLARLLRDAERDRAEIHGEVEPLQRPILVTRADASMEIARTDIFAPLLTILEVGGEGELLAALEACPYALTTAIFGDAADARRLAERITSGTVLINDLIVPTADPRVPFGGRRLSGFGATRGAEGLLEMTAAKVVTVRRGSSLRHYEATTSKHEALFRGLISASHAGGWRARGLGLQRFLAAARGLQRK